MASNKLTPSKIFLWILMALLFVGLAGFGATNLSGTVRTVGAVGEKEISVDRYARALQQEIRAMQAQTRTPVTFQQAQQLGLPDRVLSALVVARALDHEANQMGLSIGDEELVRQLRAIPAFQGPDGTFNRENYRFSLENIGLSEAEFEDDLRDESARTLLQGSVLAGNRMPDVYTNTLLSFALETRDVTWAALDRFSVTEDLPAATPAELQAFYDDNIADYTRGEAREITYAMVTPDMLLDTVEVEEELLRQSYEERTAEFNLPERRLVERLVYSDTAAAQAAIDRIAAGESDFVQEVETRGLALSDTDMGDVTSADLGAAADVVFAGTVGAVVGPADTDLGPALFRVNAILPAQNTSFEEAREALRSDLALDRARRVITTLAEGAEDLLAGGATVEDLASETEMTVSKIAWVEGDDTDIAAYPAFRDWAASVTLDDFPEIVELGDGGIFAARLDGIAPPAPLPFDEVASQVATDLDTQRITASLTAQAEGYLARLNEGQTFEALGLPQTNVESAMSRDAFIEGLPLSAVQALFTLEPGAAQIFPGEGRVVIAQVNTVNPADLASEQAQQFARAIEDQAASDVAQDLYNALAADIQRRAGIDINQQALNAVHSSLQ